MDFEANGVAKMKSKIIKEMILLQKKLDEIKKIEKGDLSNKKLLEEITSEGMVYSELGNYYK